MLLKNRFVRPRSATICRTALLLGANASLPSRIRLSAQQRHQHRRSDQLVYFDSNSLTELVTGEVHQPLQEAAVPVAADDLPNQLVRALHSARSA